MKTGKRAKAKFRVGQLVFCRETEDYHKVVRIEYVGVRPTYQFDNWFSSVGFRESDFRPLTATEIGPRAKG